MARPAARGVMQTSDPGSSPPHSSTAQGGFTLLELLIVVAVIALASGLSILALRDPASQRLEQEAARLAALLDAARLESRTSGQAVSWQPIATPQADFRFEPPLAVMGGPSTPGGSAASRSVDAWPTQWLHPGVQAEVIGAPRLVLGPEPLLPPQRVHLRLAGQELVLASDGLGGFRVEDRR
jgi:general secretion pathway protein H